MIVAVQQGILQQQEAVAPGVTDALLLEDSSTDLLLLEDSSTDVLLLEDA